MSKFQLWGRDEYGQGSIYFTSENINEIFKNAKEKVTDINVNNSLTSDDRDRNWEAYFPFIESSKKSDNNKKMFFYGGKDTLNKDVFFSVDKKSGSVSVVDKDYYESLSIKIYLGNISTSKVEKHWFAKDTKMKEINSLSDQNLNGKTIFFIKAL